MITLDKDQLAAMARINEGKNVFLTGAAGTGKSSVTVEMIRRRLGERSLKVCATTGVAALNLRDKLAALFGQDVETSTIYRWSGIGIGPRPEQSFGDYYEWMSKRGYAWAGTCSRIRGTKMLVIDEISMLPGRTLDFIDYVCRCVRGNDLPFGGIQVVAVGDFLQLPPVSKTGTYDWAFQSAAWELADFCAASLRTVHRQADGEFVGLLNMFREGHVTRDGAALLKSRVAMFPDKDLLRLLTHNAQVDKWNGYQLNCIEKPEIVLTADGDGPTDEVAWLQKNLVTPTVLRIKDGARVMITANLPDANVGPGGGLAAANGDMGTVLGYDGKMVSVKLDSGKVLYVQPHKWEFDPTSEHETGYFQQFPLRLAWAATIHKSQGLTLDRALVDIRAAREPGQAYVALSRVRGLPGLFMKDMFKGVWVSDEAREFHRKIEAGWGDNVATIKTAEPAFTLTSEEDY
ncbi:DEAD/DEAH box helicase [Luteolibacter arcticus]|uniref:DEAD/DEAH box helicase n=1 Tax=Luteolibacter arcticus TaxID=1581411 RepID=A0ABT3GDG4_9BACT|nr:DEAD/DEAH box helicase [Luteolibacter arcticus]MCW1921303.1 DEAD/DEAH box helicase [Luteolibacter arcticus]